MSKQAKEFIVEVINPVTELIKKHFSYFLVLSGLLPFVIGFVTTYYFAHGDVKTAVYIINEAGLQNIWSTGLFVFLGSLMNVGLLLGVYLALKTDNKKRSWYIALTFAFLIAYAVAVVSIISITTFILSLLILYLIEKFRINKKSVAPRSQSIKNFREYLVFYFFLLIFVSITSYPQTPPARITLAHQNIAKAEIIAEKPDRYLIKNLDTKKLQLLSKADVSGISLCTDKTSVWSNSIAALFSHNRSQLLDKCN